jgi:regulatory protein
MNRITKMTRRKSREKQLNIFLDGKVAFNLLAEVAAKERLQVGQELSAGQVEALVKSDRLHRCLNTAIRYLSYRPRSEAEIRQRLQRHGFENDCTEKVITQLKEQGLVDDTTFARFWKENRESFSPRSRWLTRLELQRKGLNNSIIEQIIGEVDDGDSAYRAALSKARRLSPSEYQDFRRRLGEYLRRRGFDYDVINDTIKRVWKECGSSPG